MDLINPRIDRYMDGLSKSRDPVLQAMEREAEERGFPIVGPQVGRVLYQLALVSGARRILELGSGYGYSAYWFGQALGEKGELILTEYSAGNLKQAAGYLEKADLKCRLSFHQGDSLQIIDQLEGQFDLIFNDVDKAAYPDAFRRASPRLRAGGLFITDNVLWSGRVLDANPDPDTQGVLEYTRLIYENSDYFSSILPIRDGVSVSLKKNVE